MTQPRRFRRIIGLARTLAVYYGKPFRLRAEKRLYGAELGIGPDMLVFDIGAHVGNRVRAFTRLGARVVAVEPQTGPRGMLVRLYGRTADVTIVAAACGAQPGTAVLHVSERSPTLSSLKEDWLSRIRRTSRRAGVVFGSAAGTGGSSRWDGEETVEVTTLDALIAEHGRPDFIKIDVEGFEAEVLGGLSRSVPQLSFEFLPASRDVALRCIERLEGLAGYEYNYSPGETMRLSHRRWLAAEEMADRLAAAPPDAPSGDVYARERRSRRMPQPPLMTEGLR
ncbi:MAG: FkbM family methyltransferase [Spirochaetaceae bacterium]